MEPTPGKKNYPPPFFAYTSTLKTGSTTLISFFLASLQGLSPAVLCTHSPSLERTAPPFVFQFCYPKRALYRVFQLPFSACHSTIKMSNATLFVFQFSCPDYAFYRSFLPPCSADHSTLGTSSTTFCNTAFLPRVGSLKPPQPCSAHTSLVKQAAPFCPECAL